MSTETYVPLVYTRRASLLSRGLQGFLWSEWSHVAVLDVVTGNAIEAVFGHGVREVDLDVTLAGTQYQIVAVPTPNPRAVIAVAREQVGKPYDTRGCLGIAVRRRWQDDDSFFCSELAAFAFHEAGDPKFSADAWRITPRDWSIRNYRVLEHGKRGRPGKG